MCTPIQGKVQACGCAPLSPVLVPFGSQTHISSRNINQFHVNQNAFDDAPETDLVLRTTSWTSRQVDSQKRGVEVIAQHGKWGFIRAKAGGRTVQIPMAAGRRQRQKKSLDNSSIERPPLSPVTSYAVQLKQSSTMAPSTEVAAKASSP